MYPDALAPSESTANRGAVLPPARLLRRAVEQDYVRIGPSESFSWRAVGFAERLVCAVALAALSPIWLVIALSIAIFSGESPLIAVLRTGRFGTPLWLLKFRTMWATPRITPWTFRLVEYVVDEAGPLRKEPTDARVTSALARFCRRYSLDEMPQLLNVIAGEMSLVAPRPLTSSELREHYGADAAEVLSVRPGVTGLWQVSGRNALSYAERRQLDVQLVRTLNLRLYLRILARTIPVVLTGRNSW